VAPIQRLIQLDESDVALSRGTCRTRCARRFAFNNGDRARSPLPAIELRAVEAPAGHTVAGGKGRLPVPCAAIPLLGMTCDACRQQRAPTTLPQRCGIWISPGVASEASGKRRLAVVPRSGVDVTISAPPWAAMIS
jgi:hypothetical protein